jgi:origin recognition complex subunit 5
MISHLSWEQLGTKGICRPQTVFFPGYAEKDIVDILSLDCPPKESKPFFKDFAEMVYRTFSHACKDLEELRFILSQLFAKYIEPVKNGEGSI